MNKKQIRAIFRRETFERDGYKCKCCGVAGYDRQEPVEPNKVPLDSHHITNRRHFKNGGYNTGNGISVCDTCHLNAERQEEGFEPDKLYEMIGSSLEEAERLDDLVTRKHNN